MPDSMPAAGGHLGELVESLASADGTRRKAARVALVRAGVPAIPALLGALRSADLNTRWEAAKALGELPDASAASGLVAALTDEGPGVRWLAAEALSRLGRQALEPLLTALVTESGSIWLREGAHHVLLHLSRGDLEDVVEPVRIALEGVEPTTASAMAAHLLLEQLSHSTT